MYAFLILGKIYLCKLIDLGKRSLQKNMLIISQICYIFRLNKAKSDNYFYFIILKKCKLFKSKKHNFLDSCMFARFRSKKS